MKNIITLIVLSLVLYLSNTKQIEAQTLSVHSSTGFINPERFIDGDNRSFSYLKKLTTGEIIFKLDRLCTINQLTVYLSEAYEDNAQFYVSTNAISYTKIGEVDDEYGVFNFTVNKDAKYIKITGECSSDPDILELAELSIDASPLPVYTTQYQYDASGNRILRNTILLKSGEGESLAQGGRFNPDKLKLESLEEYLGGNNLKIYPNPTRGEMAIEFIDFPEEEKIKVCLYDMKGSLILDETVDNQFYLLDINNKPNGNYILKLTLGEFQKTYQIVKQ